MTRRPAEYTCVICLESLFESRDDVEDVIPVVTTSCGHVFHRPCITAALKASSERWLANEREHDPDTDLDLSDARADCPSCRDEIFADPDTGELELTRLFVSQAEGSSSSTQASSSPMRRGTADAPLYSLARRAKSVRELTERLSATSRSHDVHLTLERAKQVVHDGASDRALDSVKNHLQTLSASIQALSATLLSNPLIPELQAAQTVLENSLDMERRARKSLRDHEMPATIRMAVNAEKQKGLKMIEMERVEKVKMMTERDQQRAARKAAQVGWEQQLAAFKTEVDEAKKALKFEVEGHQETSRQLRERTALVKTYQTKLESRKHLRDNAKELERENAQLRKQLDSAGSLAASSSALPSRDEWTELEDESYGHGADESFEIDFDQTSSSPGPRLHPTARVITCDTRRGLGASKRPRTDESEGVLQPTGRGNPFGNQPGQRQGANPFKTTKSAGEKKKTLEYSPYGVDKEKEKEKKKPRRSIVDLTGTSPDEPGPSLGKRSGSKFFPPSNFYDAASPSVRLKSTRPLADQLGLKDAFGRPTKGVASGPRVSRR